MAKAHTLVDNFNDNQPDTSLWTVGGSIIRETNGRVEIRPLNNETDSTGNYTSAASYDLTDSSVHVELVRPLRRSTRTTAHLIVNRNAAELGIRVQGGGMLLLTVAGADGVTSVLVERPYDPERHRWLRLREESGTVYWEVSADGEEWIALASRSPHPFDLTAVTVRIGAGTFLPVTAPGVAIFDNLNVRATSLARRVEERRLSAREVRDRAAELAAERRHEEHANNNDEVNYQGASPPKGLAGSYSKGLKHDSVGDPDPASYASLLRALESRDPQDFDEIVLGTLTSTQLDQFGRLKLTNPQAGLAFDTAGPDAQEQTMVPAPRFDSAQTAHEAGELYWMAAARDVHFSTYGASSVISAAILSLGGSNTVTAEFPQFGGTAPVTAQNIFRGIYPGEQVGPYVSQFLLKGNQDKRKPIGLGREADDGYVSYGSRVINQRQVPAAANTDYLTSFSTWLNAQNGLDLRGGDTFDNTFRFIRNLRDGATFVHFDQVLDAWYNTAWILMSEPAGDQLDGSTALPQVDLEFPKDQGNPYDPPGTAGDSPTQAGFATFGPPHLLQVLGEVLGRALRAVWWRKWGVHRRLRPEEFGERVDNWIQSRRDYPINPSIKNSLMTGRLAPYFAAGTYLLPQAYPEGAPTHPAYGAGHAAGSGACATILKAFFDESKAIETPRQASLDGLSLDAYTGTDAGQMTVGGELNKLAGNIALFRSAAGVHWRSDYTESLPFGEAIAIGLLQEMSLGFNEDDAFFELTKFDGQRIRIFDGKVVPVV